MTHPLSADLCELAWTGNIEYTQAVDTVIGSNRGNARSIQSQKVYRKAGLLDFREATAYHFWKPERVCLLQGSGRSCWELKPVRYESSVKSPSGQRRDTSWCKDKDGQVPLRKQHLVPFPFAKCLMPPLPLPPSPSSQRCPMRIASWRARLTRLALADTEHEGWWSRWRRRRMLSRDCSQEGAWKWSRPD